MRDKVPKDYGNMPMEVGIYANACANQAGKGTMLGILIGWFYVFVFSFFLQSYRHMGKKAKEKE